MSKRLISQLTQSLSSHSGVVSNIYDPRRHRSPPDSPLFHKSCGWAAAFIILTALTLQLENELMGECKAVDKRRTFIIDFISQGFAFHN